MTRPFFELRGRAGCWHWRLVSTNGRVMATGETHTRKADARRAAIGVLRTIVAHSVVSPHTPVWARWIKGRRGRAEFMMWRVSHSMTGAKDIRVFA